MRRAKQQAELDRQLAEIEALRPFLDLAREIEHDVNRAIDEGSSSVEAMTEALRRIPEQKRDEVVRAAFDRLPADQQWEIIERAFDDDEIRAHLTHERAVRLAAAQRAAHHRELVHDARVEHRLDTTVVPVGELLTLGLFREPDASTAVPRGHRSDTCARQLVLRAFEPGRFQVIEDVFNPKGAYFVTSDYDERTWRTERLPGHASVRVGSRSGRPEEATFEPILYPGGRVDVDLDGQPSEGHLHLGFAMLGDHDVFADE